MNDKHFKILSLAGGVILTLALLNHFVTPWMAQSRMEKLLRAYGFEEARFPAANIAKGTMVFENVTLDRDAFSTVGAIQAAFTPGGRIKSVSVKDMALTGEMTWDTLPTFAGLPEGLQMPPLKKLPPLLSLNGVRLDIFTEAGGLKFNTKGQFSRQKDGRYALQAAAWGTQHQLKLDSRMQGWISPEGPYSLEVDVRDARFNLDQLTSSRINGWLTLERLETGKLRTGGQLAAGSFNFGEVPFSKATLTFDDSKEQGSVIIRAKAGGKQSVEVVIDLSGTAETPVLYMTAETNKIDALLAFRRALRDSLKNSPYVPANKKEALLRLLSAHSDKELKQAFRAVSYDRARLEIKGPLNNLTGKVVTRKGSGKRGGAHTFKLKG